jgi:pimeloyl-ACP methyl ester carboxylesterase
MMELIIAGAMSGLGGVTAIGAEPSPDGDGGATAGYFGQIMAIVNWMASGGAFTRLSTIETPTLVLHGGDDLLLPVGNGELIARQIPGAAFRVWDDAGHALNFERADDVNTELMTHLTEAQARV